MRGVTAFAALLLLALPAQARMHAGPSQMSAGHRLQGMIAPLDGGGSFSAPAAAYSLRRLKSTYAGPAVKLRRASDSATQDISFLGFTGFTGAPIDTAAAAAFCASTTCFVVTWYDQSGNGQDVTQATAANQPQFIFNCAGVSPCIRVTTDTAPSLQSVGTITVASPLSLSAVANRRSGLGACAGPFVFFNYIYAWAGGGGWFLHGVNEIGILAADAVWHAMAGTIGAGSAFLVDETETAAAVTITAGSGGVVMPYQSPVGTVCDWGEGVIWNGYGLTAAERQAVVNNQRGYWGIP